jgi:site-specific DNA recombinase
MTENFSTGSPLGRAMIGFLAVFAQLEKDKINERMIMGKDARAKEGKWHGGSSAPVGYDYDPATDKLTVNEYEALQIKEAIDLFLKGTPLRTICNIFGEKGYTYQSQTGKISKWEPKRLKYVFANKLYVGYIRHRGEWFKGEHDPIITEETFDKLDSLLKQRAEDFAKHGRKCGGVTSYLGGILRCKKCGAKYSKNTWGTRKSGVKSIYYTCYSRSNKVPRMVKDPNCKNKNWKMEILDEAIFNEIRKLAVSPEYIREIKASKKVDVDVEAKVKVIDTEIKKINEQISRFMDLYGIGKFTIEQVSGKVDPLNEQKVALEKEREKLTATEGTLSEAEALEIVESFEEAFDSGDFTAIRSIIESLIYYIELDNDDVYIHWKI